MYVTFTRLLLTQSVNTGRSWSPCLCVYSGWYFKYLYVYYFYMMIFKSICQYSQELKPLPVYVQWLVFQIFAVCLGTPAAAQISTPRWCCPLLVPLCYGGVLIHMLHQAHPTLAGLRVGWRPTGCAMAPSYIHVWGSFAALAVPSLCTGGGSV